MKQLLLNDDSSENYQEAVSELISTVEPIAGFRPEDPIQAISLLVSAFKNLEPAMEALQNLAVEMDIVRLQQENDT